MYRFLLTIWAFTTCLCLFAQQQKSFMVSDVENRLITKEWSVKDGLASNSVRKIVTTPEGYLFIATYDGISLFDGSHFVNYNSANVPALQSSNVYDLCTDRNGTIWIGTHRGIVLYKNQEFIVPKALEQFKNYNIQCLNFDNHGVLWIGTTSQGVLKYQNNKIEKIKALKILEKKIIRLLFPDNNGNMWIGTEDGDLLRYNGKTYVKIANTEGSNGIFEAIQDKNGDFLLGTRNGLYTIESDSLKLVNNQLDFINDIKIDGTGQVWIATNSGIYFINKENGDAKKLFKNRDFANRIIYSIYFDNDLVWLGTYRKGFMQLRMGAFENYPFATMDSKEIPSALAQINNSTLWVGTDEGKLYQLKKGQYQQISLSGSIDNSRIKSIYIDSNNNKWICSYKGLLQISNGQELLLDKSNGLPDITIRGITETKDGNYWVATRQSGLYFLTKNLKVTHTININNGLSSNFVMSISTAKDGKILVATKNGFDIIEGKKIIKQYNLESGLREDLIFNIYQDKEDESVFWLATIAGLSRIKEDEITNFSKESGLVFDKIFDVVEDDYGYFWLPGTNGIQRVKKSQLNDLANGTSNRVLAVIFNEVDGLYDQQYVNASKALKKQNGEIVFNTIAGISILKPEIANNTTGTAYLSIHNISTESGVFENNGKDIALPAFIKYLQINYSYIDFLTPDKVEFEYQLFPFDNEWYRAGKERSAKYTNIPAGDYEFRLRALLKSHGDAVLEEKISFTIKSSFIETIWFKLLIIAAVILIVRFIYLIRVRTIQNQKELLEAEVFIRTDEINQQKMAIERHVEELKEQKEEIAIKSDEIILARNEIEQAYFNLKLLSELGKKITSALTEEDIVQKVYQNLNELMDTDLVSVGNYQPKKGFIRFQSSYYKGKKMPEFRIHTDRPKCIICNTLLNNKDIISINFAKDFPEYKQSFPGIDPLLMFASVIILPIRVHSKTIGVITTQSFRKEAYSDYHLNLMQNLAVYVGIAIENAKSYRKIEKQKDKLQSVNAAKDRMFSVIGHDLRGPVGTIKSFLDIIVDNPEMTNPESMQEILKTMQQSLGSAYALLDNLLLWARNQRGQMEFKPGFFYIKQPIDESVTLVAENARSKNIAIETIINYNVQVYADQNMITTVLRNLISNAIKFTPRDGGIQIVTERVRWTDDDKNHEDLVEIKIIDFGIGISEENIVKIMKTTQLFSTPGTANEQGSGLGISICNDFLKVHKQKLYVENNKEKLNKPGTTFRFYLPIKK